MEYNYIWANKNWDKPTTIQCNTKINKYSPEMKIDLKDIFHKK